jgi:ribosomal protein L37AE/L43A
MENSKSTNSCPVCGQLTKENEAIIYCENCGFNINKKEEIKPKANNER